MKKSNHSKNGSSNCPVTFNIEVAGDMNVYNCCNAHDEKDNECKCDTEPDCTSSATGACVPVSMGAKPKQSRKNKLDRLLSRKPKPSAFATSFLHTCKRYVAGKTSGSELESKMFEKFRTLSPAMKRILKCTTESFDSLPSKHKGLFASDLMLDIDTPITSDSLASAFGQELTGLVSGLALENTEAPLEELPGKVRLYEYGTSDDVYPNQIHIFKINGLRTNDYVPYLNKEDYLPEEFQQICTPRQNGDIIEWDCSMQTPPCDGHGFDDVCLKVYQIQSGTSVTLIGVNFFDIDTKIQFRLKSSTDDYNEIDAFVYGDLETPVTEVINGTEINIVDNRVQDKIFFTIPPDVPPGIYEFAVAVPNSSGFSGPGFGDVLYSNFQYIEVIPPSTARFQIASEKLWARRETSPQSWGSDEVGIKINTIPFFADLSLGEMQQHSFRFDDVDSGETRAMERVLFSQSQQISGLVMSIIGFEIDGEEAYANQITEWTDVFYDLLKEQWAYILSGSAIAKEVFKRLINLGFWGYIIIAVAVAITLAIDLFVALWAPADLIIQDTLGFSVSEIVRLTNINVPAPSADSNKTLYTTPGDIDVRLMLSSKSTFQYKEERGYLSDAEDSWYNISFRYNRLV